MFTFWMIITEDQYSNEKQERGVDPGWSKNLSGGFRVVRTQQFQLFGGAIKRISKETL